MDNTAHIFLFYLVILSSCNIQNAEEMISLSNNEIVNLVNELREKDVNRAEDWQIILNYSEYWKNNISDGCKERLFQWVDPNLLQKETYQKWIKLSKLHDAELGAEKNEIGNGKKRAINEFLDAVMNTEVWKSFYKYLSQRGYQHATSSKTFRNFIRQLWFGRYFGIFNDIYSSGFEHVFFGEHKNGKASGLHSWLRFYMLEQGETNFAYCGSIFKPLKLMAVLKFNWEKQIKKTTFFIGTSPEFDMALNTLCLLTRPSNRCFVMLESCSFTIITQPIVQQGKTFLRTAFPAVDYVTRECLQKYY